jgi:glycine hydroxymethyltransferase
MNTVAAIAVTLFEAEQESFKEYGKQVLKNAKVLSEELMRLGCKLVTNGTDNHLMLIDCIKSFGTTGDVIEKALDAVGITVNKNAVPDDTNPPFKPSGVRLGTPAITTRGLKEDKMTIIADVIVKAANNLSDEFLIQSLRNQVKELSIKYPVPVLGFE